MRNSLLWILSILLSGLAHYGLIAAAAHLPLPSSQQDQLAQIVLGGDAFEPLSLDAGNASPALGAAAAASPEIAEVKAEEPSSLPPSEIAAIEPAKPPAEQLTPPASTELAEAKAEQLTPPASTELAEAKAEATPVAQAAGSASLPASGAEVSAAAAASEIAEAPPPSSDVAAAPPPEPAAALGPPEVLDAGTQLSSLAPEPQAGNAQVTPSDTAADSPPASGPAAELTAETPSTPLSSGAAATLSSGDFSSPAGSPALGSSAESKVLPSSAGSSTATEITAEPEPPVAAQQALQQETQVASAATSATQAMSQAEKVKSFLANYPAGKCMMATVADAGGARPGISGLGGEGAPIAEFAKEFRASVGVDPTLSLEKIRDAQCPAVDFIRAMGGPSSEMKLSLDRAIVADTHTLTGNIRGFRKGRLSLLLVDDEGGVRDISGVLAVNGDKIMFAIGVRVLGQGRGRNQLVLAIASPQAMAFDVTGQPGEALRVFEEIERASRQANGAIAVAYGAFRIE